jgi:flavodoxin
MKCLVVYYSETGNTEKVANTVAEVLNVKPARVEKARIKEDYDLLIVGSPVHAGKPSKKIIEFLDKIPKNRVRFGAAFCTMHFIGGKRTCNFIANKMQEKGIEYLDGFWCKGRSRLIGSIGPRVFQKTRPNKKDLKQAKEFTEIIESKVESGF